MLQHTLAGTVPGTVNPQGSLTVLLFSDLFELFAECFVQLKKAVFTALTHGFTLGHAGRALATLATAGKKHRPDIADGAFRVLEIRENVFYCCKVILVGPGGVLTEQGRKLAESGSGDIVAEVATGRCLLPLFQLLLQIARCHSSRLPRLSGIRPPVASVFDEGKQGASCIVQAIQCFE